MSTATESFEAVRKSAEEIACDKTQQFPEAASPGDTFRQGDLYIELLKCVPVSASVAKAQEAQLAPGTTQGSRHILDSMEGVTVFQRSSPTALDGPVLKVEQERTVTHPEHGDVILPPGCYGVTYQRAYADEIRRVAD